MSTLNELKSYLRDINLEILMKSPNVEIDISKRYYNRFRLFYPSRKLIKYVTDIGGVLTGSRAIRCFTIEGKPILEHIINRAKAEGFSHFILAIYHLGHMIEEYFGTGEKFGVRIDYLRETSPLGTAGALSLLDPLPSSAIIVTNGDVITDIRYGELLDFHEQNGASATMAVRMHEWQNPFGVVQTQGIEITSYEEKPISRSNINAGVYVIDPSFLKLLKKSERYDMPTLFELIQSKGERIVACPIHETWLDVGSPEDLELARFTSGS